MTNESTTYTAILEEGIERGYSEGLQIGRRDEVMRLLVLLGTRRFGIPTSSNLSNFENASLLELEQAAERLLTAEGWNGLLKN